MKRNVNCPFCKAKNVKEVCECGAYRVNEDNFHLSMKERKTGGELFV